MLRDPAVASSFRVGERCTQRRDVYWCKAGRSGVGTDNAFTHDAANRSDGAVIFIPRANDWLVWKAGKFLVGESCSFVIGGEIEFAAVARQQERSDSGFGKNGDSRFYLSSTCPCDIVMSPKEDR